MNDTIITILLTAIASSGAWAFLQYLLDKRDNNKKAIVGLMGFTIRGECEHRIKQGGITLENLRQLQELNEIYHKQGGNGYVKTLMDKVAKLPIKDE